MSHDSSARLIMGRPSSLMFSLLLLRAGRERNDSEVSSNHVRVKAKTTLFQGIAADLRSASWLSIGLWSVFFIWTSALFFLSAIFLPLYLQQPFNDLRSSACLPDDSFDMSGDRYDPWQADGFFQITIGFGSLTFTQAKVIDLVWDIVVGRVGQALLAFHFWKAVSVHVKNSMYKSPVTYNMYWTAFIDAQPSFLSTCRVIRDSATQKSKRSRAAMAFIAIGMSFVLAFPTLASSMTGYSGRSQSFVTDAQGNLISYTAFTPVAYIIRDGERINFTSNYVVPFSSRIYHLTWGHDIEAYGQPNYLYSCAKNWDDGTECGLSQDVSEYVKAYGFYGLDATGGKANDVVTQWAGGSIPKPALNISAFYFPRETSFYGRDYIDPRINKRPYADPRNIQLTVLGENSTTYSLDYVRANGSCQPLGTYKWGFSFVQLFIVLIILLLWTVGTCTMWLKAHLTLLRRADGEVPNKYNASLVLAARMRSDLKIGITRQLTNQELDGVIKEHTGGRIDMQEAIPVQDFDLRRGLWGWVKANKWWSALLVSLALVLVAGWIIGFYILWIPIMIFLSAICLTLAVGRTTKSRLFFAACGAVLAAIVSVIILCTIIWSER
ncbi:hypothetical protein B0H67DRAFT_568303 [Lasiosphaeris hirsuta]|uniref:Uncharacterized protein n=1 Tax=Lasiosphaeris hirsuta TaxID=260670 RepID=A0AA40E6U1_9PEZI|nr:hypothetical protein B0H67DRAFT_568303 [Lasiosphaeris hirsuta]